MYTVTVLVRFNGKFESVEVACNPGTPHSELQEYAIKQLKRKEAKKNQKRNERLMRLMGL